MRNTAENIKEQFLESGVDIPIEEIEERLDKLTSKFKVPLDEARRSVVSYFLKQYDVDRNDFFASNSRTDTSEVRVADINEGGRWVDLRIKVVQLWDNTHESISQVGLIGDETGNIKFVKWARDALLDLEEGHCYHLQSVVSNEWNGKYEVTLTKNTVIEEIFDDIPARIPEEGGSSPQVSIVDINADGQWICLKAKVVQLWDTLHESMSQVGLIGDETGTIKFTTWVSSGLPDVEEGKVYLFNNVVVNQWNDRYSISINKSSSIEELPGDIEVGTATVTFTGALVDIQQGSGLIKRCPTCNRALTKGACMEHGKVDGVHDLRIKAVIDDGSVAQETIIKRELSESVSGISLEDAITMAMDAFDQGVVLDTMKSGLIGKYFTITGTRMDRYMLVDTMEQQYLLDDVTLDELILEAEVV